jgi:probable HAF family extracellular repeat protein
MKFETWNRVITVTLLTMLVIPCGVAVQNTAKQHHPHQYHHYQLNDVGTFGGPNSSYVLPPSGKLINNSGVAVGSADTPTPEPSGFCFNFDCYLAYGFKWQNGVASQLSALPGFNSSASFAVSDSGLTVGASENGTDPLTGGPAAEAVLWGKDGSLTDLGTLGGNESVASEVNNRGQVAGVALNTIPDPYTGFFLIPGATQARAFRWTKSKGMQDLGTLGGTDSTALFINDRGQINGWSFTNTTPNSVPTLCGANIPTMDPFLWENGKMTDLGSLGGTCGQSNGLNNRGQVAGVSNLAGDQKCHPFLWNRIGGMRDLGTLGGDSGVATYLNDAGEVVGVADLPGAQGCDGPEPHHAFFWKNGVMTDLGTIDGDPCSIARGINSRGQVVGAATDCSHQLNAFLWEQGGTMVDLNTLIPPNSGVVLNHALYINDRGDIASLGILSNGDIHSFVLTPCDENHLSVEGCDYSMVDAATAAAHSAARPYLPSSTQTLSRSPWSNRFHMSGLASASK